MSVLNNKPIDYKRTNIIGKCLKVDKIAPNWRLFFASNLRRSLNVAGFTRSLAQVPRTSETLYIFKLFGY